jgi:hypothetical protein
MKNKIYLIRVIAGFLVLSSFVMCTKSVIVKKPDTGTPTEPTGPTDPAMDCTYTVQPSEWFVDGKDIAAGAVICIPAGTRGALLLKNFKGTAEKPIAIINKGGKVTFNVDAKSSYAFKTQNCQYFKIMGNGDAAVKYGFDVSGGNISMTMDDLSSDFEIANVEVRNSGFAGIMAKTDPTCDVATQRGHFIMKNVSIHDNYVHQTGGEGFYIGNSFYADGVSLECGKVLPHDVTNIKLYNNLVDSTGAEGIQVGSAISGCEVYGNTVIHPGISPFAAAQNNGIQIGEGTGGKCYNNLVKGAPGNGIIVLGLGDNVVYNNIIINSGEHGIFADSRYTPGPNYQFINNTIIKTGRDGIRLNSATILMNTVINNVIVSPGSGQYVKTNNSGVKLTASNNYTGTDVSAVKFKNYSADDFHLLSSSPLINTGANVAAQGVATDYYGTARPAGAAYDVGAVEYK